jgi:hypothetical protein
LTCSVGTERPDEPAIEVAERAVFLVGSDGLEEGVVWHVLSDPVVVEGSNIDVVDEEGRERIQAFLFPFDGERTCCQ